MIEITIYLIAAAMAITFLVGIHRVGDDIRRQLEVSESVIRARDMELSKVWKKAEADLAELLEKRNADLAKLKKQDPETGKATRDRAASLRGCPGESSPVHDPDHEKGIWFVNIFPRVETEGNVSICMGGEHSSQYRAEMLGAHARIRSLKTQSLGILKIWKDKAGRPEKVEIVDSGDTVRFK